MSGLSREDDEIIELVSRLFRRTDAIGGNHIISDLTELSSLLSAVLGPERIEQLSRSWEGIET